MRKINMYKRRYPVPPLIVPNQYQARRDRYAIEDPKNEARGKQAELQVWEGEGVTRCGTFTVRGILYSAPSRLIGHRLKVRLYSDRLDCYLGGARVLTLARGVRSPTGGRGRMLDYRHFIEALKRKPQAFKGLVFRDALFPREAYRRAWDKLAQKLCARQACQTMIGLLELAAKEGVEALLANRLDALLASGELPDVKALREEFAPRPAQLPTVHVEIPAASSYDALLTEAVPA
jgi:hypothetical protein